MNRSSTAPMPISPRTTDSRSFRRVRAKPRDKAKVEQGVLLAERWILASLRNHRFSSLDTVNEAIAPLLAKLNDRPMRKIGRSRRQMFDAIERSVLRPLPENAYVLASFATATVNIDYHV